MTLPENSECLPLMQNCIEIRREILENIADRLRVRCSFAKLRKGNITFAISVRPRGTTGIPLNGFS